ncbi:MAG: hypothetical protein ACPGSB_09490 [Opitutales bacterium]
MTLFIVYQAAFPSPFPTKFTDTGHTEQTQVQVKKIEDPDDADSQLVLCRSAQRRLKEVRHALEG